MGWFFGVLFVLGGLFWFGVGGGGGIVFVMVGKSVRRVLVKVVKWNLV